MGVFRSQSAPLPKQRSARARSGPSDLQIWTAVVLAFVFFGLLANCFRKGSREETHSSSTRRQPLVIVQPNFLPPSQFSTLQATLPSHPWIVSNNLNEDNFQHTRGWVTKFNAEGVERFRSLAVMRDVIPYFDRVRHSDSNAFVMNVLVANEPPRGKDAVGVHQDDTAAVRHRDQFLAHQVNVLYVQVPLNMTGGQLEAWPVESEQSERNKAVIYAAENVMVEFKGSAFHRVGAFSSLSKGERMSLVLEQYRIPEKFYENTVVFCWNEECDDAEAVD